MGSKFSTSAYAMLCHRGGDGRPPHTPTHRLVQFRDVVVAAQERADGKSNTQSMARISMSNERVPGGVRRTALGAANGVPRGTHRARCAAHSARRVARGAWHGASDAGRAACGAQHTAQVCSVHNTAHAPCTARGMRHTREAARAAPRGVRAAHPVWENHDKNKRNLSPA